jgi:hypothetical protein
MNKARANMFYTDKMLFGRDKVRYCEGLFPDISVALETACYSR